MIRTDSIVANAGTLLTMDTGGGGPLSEGSMERVSAIKNGAVAIENGRIRETGATDDILNRYQSGSDIVDAGGRLVLPGFVDSHTHALFAGSREGEVAVRLRGASYIDILKSGGGIHRTVSSTKRADKEALVKRGLLHLDRMAAHGSTTVEIKSGYGLDLETEKKILSAIREVGRRHPVEVVTTFLGAHAVPPDTDRKVYLDTIEKNLPELARLAEFFDVFCEDGAFSRDESVRLLRAAGDEGFKLKAHVGQFTDLGGAGAVSTLGAISCDHLDVVSDDQLAIMKKTGTIAVLLPGTPFFLKTGAYPEGRRIIDAGVPVALATDFNPGSCPCFSMQMMIALAVFECGMTAKEALVAATINSAYALDRGGDVGSLEPGKRADMVMLDVETPEQIPYYFGVNLVHRVIKDGRTIYRAADTSRVTP